MFLIVQNLLVLLLEAVNLDSSREADWLATPLPMTLLFYAHLP